LFRKPKRLRQPRLRRDGLKCPMSILLLNRIDAAISHNNLILVTPANCSPRVAVL
jgi:hypothetical protein